MKKLLLCALAFLIAGIGPVMAADMAVKTAPANPFQYPAADGIYFGIGTLALGGPATGAVPTGAGFDPNSIITNQMSIAGIVGYAWNWPNSSAFVAVEGWFGMTNLNGSSPGLSFSGPAMFKQRVLVGAPIAQIAQFFPTLGIQLPTFPALPSGVAISSTKAYIAGGVNEDDITVDVFGVGSNKDWSITPSIDIGVLAQLTSGSALDAFLEYKFQDKAVCVGGLVQVACGKVGNQYGAGLALKW